MRASAKLFAVATIACSLVGSLVSSYELAFGQGANQEIFNVKSGYCLDIDSFSGSGWNRIGQVTVHPCYNKPGQYQSWFISPSGTIVNVRTSLCLTAEGELTDEPFSQRLDVTVRPCLPDANQYPNNQGRGLQVNQKWAIDSNGFIFNEGFQRCLDVFENRPRGRVTAQGCYGRTDTFQVWETYN